MFTGLVEALGTVRSALPDGAGGSTLNIAMLFAKELALGESVAINGCCLTVVERDDETARFQAGPETLTKTNLGELKPGDRVNLERSLRIGDRFGGHLVTGHIDGIGTIATREASGDWQTLGFTSPLELLRQMVPKGSVAVDGVSLTLVEVRSDRFSVMLIPHTLDMTTLGLKPIGGKVNLETDIIGKHVAQWLSAYQQR